MKQTIEHINLLERSGPAYTVGWWLAGTLGAVLLAVAVYGGRLWSGTLALQHQRDALETQLQQVHARVEQLNQDRVRSAGTLALRQEVETLRPQAEGARLMVQAIGAQASGDGRAAMGQVLGAVARTTEPGLWMTSMQLGEQGHRLELQGQAHDGDTVLRYARHVNDALQSEGLRMDNLELQPAVPLPGTSDPRHAAAPAAVKFHLY